ncbi:uncharacterized protein LOC134770590 [Penaeus indicus]|uniref:uncharacterized protein LOC134770590 n=1 Tax=Penaeus indicus TaxID=29960 RepID=UPI00300CA928
MKWRDRISILSRKRTLKSFVGPGQEQNDVPSGSGSGHNGPQALLGGIQGSSVENTLSQIRPVIGPDHKSYYILLRGNEDSFMCIQPAKDVIDSLDDVVKNVVNSVKLSKLSQESESPPVVKKPRYSQGKTYKSTNRQNLPTTKNNGVLNSHVQISEGDRAEAATGLENLLLCRVSPEETNNVVENVVLNRRVQNINSEQQNKMVRTSMLLYPLVQNSRLAQGSAVRANSKQKTSLLLSSDSVNELDDPLFIPSESDLIQNIAQSCTAVRLSDQKQELSSLEPTEPELCDPSEYVTTEIKDLNSILPAPVGQSPSPTELCLIAREGTLLSEEEITSQIKTMIESEQLVVGEGKQIVVIRVSAREAVVKIVGNEAESVNSSEHQEIREASETLQHEEQEMSEMSTVVKEEELCYDPEVVIANNNNNSINNNHEEGVEYLLSPYQGLMSKREVESDADYVVESFIGPSPTPPLQESPEDERLAYQIEEVAATGATSIADPLITGAEKDDGEIVVFQREDGAFVNQDGTPVSSELQYLIATSQQDFAPSLEPVDHSDSIFVSPGTFDHHHTIDVNTGL